MKKILIISQRNFGDAVILSSVLNQFDTTNFIIDVLSKKEFESIFKKNKNIKSIITANFPIASYKSFNILNFIQALFKIRNEKYDLVIDLIGDFRERLIGYFCSGYEFVSVEREKNNKFNKLIRRGLKNLPDKNVLIKSEMVNIYNQIDYVFSAIGFIKKENQLKNKSKNNIIGIHPFASQECRMWDWSKWIKVINYFLFYNKRIFIFCAPMEKDLLVKELGIFINHKNIKIVSSTIDNFFINLEKVDLLIGLDSFSIHAAYSKNVPNIMLCGANDYNLWKTPLTKVISKGNKACEYWPCYNKPKCNDDYKCMKKIMADDVVDSVKV